MKIAVKTLENKAAGEIDLNDAIFGLEVRKDLLHRAVRWQRAAKQAGTHKTKGISEVSGTGKKPWRQKGTGRARAGSLRRPQDRGGMVVFGPQSRSHAHDLPKKLRKLALKTALSAKAAEGKIVVLDKAEAKSNKTKDMVAALSKLGVSDNALFITGTQSDQNFTLATRNLPRLDVLPQQGANVYDILRRETLVLTKDAIAQLEERLS